MQKAAALRETGLCLGFELGLYTFENVSVFHLKTEEKAKKKPLSGIKETKKPKREVPADEVAEGHLTLILISRVGKTIF